MLDYELLTLNKLGISYNIVYNENEIRLNVSYNISTLVNLNNYVLNIVSCGKPILGISYYSSPDFYSVSRMYPSIIFDLYEHILDVLKIKYHSNKLKQELKLDSLGIPEDLPY